MQVRWGDELAAQVREHEQFCAVTASELHGIAVEVGHVPRDEAHASEASVRDTVAATCHTDETVSVNPSPVGFGMQMLMSEAARREGSAHVEVPREGPDASEASSRETVAATCHTEQTVSVNPSPLGFGMQMLLSEAARLDDSPHVKDETSGRTLQDECSAQDLAELATLHDDSNTAGAHSRSEQKPQGTEHHRSAQWLSVFNIRMEEGVKPRYEADALLAAAEDLAKKMRPFVTMPDMKCTNACVPDSRD